VAIPRGTRVHGSLPRRRVQATGPGQFALDVRRWVEKAKERSDLVLRKVSIDLLTSVVQMSPVGNPELWAANASAIYGRQTHNLFTERVNATILPGPRGGKARRVRLAGKKKLAKLFPLQAGKGYVGGRFKGNWQVSVNRQPVGETGRIDPDGSETLSAGAAVANGVKAGDVIYLQNNVPYAIALEYGWSKQAPGGMVRITITRFQQLVDQAAREAKAEIP
jgi:hypothetical protein